MTEFRAPIDRQDGRRRIDGMTLTELMVALAVGTFLSVGAVQIYAQSRGAYLVNESIARVQETAQFAMDTLEADLRMAGHYGLSNRGDSIEGRATALDANPLSLSVPTNQVCAADWALALERPVEGSDDYGLGCAAASSSAQADSDTITIRRTTVDPVPFDASRLQVQSTRLQGRVFDHGALPAGFSASDSQTHNLLVNSYYVDADSSLMPGVPTLRRKSLGVRAGAPAVIDLEVAPGVENLQIRFGLDTNGDSAVDRYVDPGHATLGHPSMRILTVQIWLVVRSVAPEVGIVDETHYEPGNEDLGVPNDGFRRLQLSKTILLRNARA